MKHHVHSLQRDRRTTTMPIARLLLKYYSVG